MAYANRSLFVCIVEKNRELLACGQACGSHGLADTAELLIGQSQIDGLVDLGILVSQNLLAGFQQQVAALTGHHAAQQQNMLEGVQVIVVSQWNQSNILQKEVFP